MPMPRRPCGPCGAGDHGHLQSNRCFLRVGKLEMVGLMLRTHGAAVFEHGHFSVRGGHLVLTHPMGITGIHLVLFVRAAEQYIE